MKYFYFGSGKGILLLNYDKHEKSIEQHENWCFQHECAYESCKLVYFNQKGKTKSDTIIFKSECLISNFNFWTQFFSLLSFFTNVSLHKLMIRLVELAISKIEAIKKLKECIIWFKLIISLIILIFCLLLFAQMIANYEDKRDYPVKKETITNNQFELETINLFVCVTVNSILLKNYSDLSLEYKNNHMNKILLELEKATDQGFNGTVDRIYLEFQSKKIEINWNLNRSKVLFIYRLKKSFKRCFQVEVNASEPKYQAMIAISKLVCIFKHSNYNLYLVPKTRDFNTKCYEHYPYSKFVKKVIKRSRLNKKKMHRL